MSLKTASKALVIFDGKIVSVQRENKPTITNPNKWNLPGGAIEAGETPEQALIRELKEEIDLSVSSLEPMGTTTYSDGVTVYRFAVHLTKEQADQVKLISEGQALEWLTLSELLSHDISKHLRAYLTTCTADIQETLKGKTTGANHFCNVATR